MTGPRVVKGPFIFALCVSGNHNHCPGALRAPDRTVYCECPHHEGQKVEPPEVLVRTIAPGKRDRRLADQLGDILATDGVVEIDAPTDQRELINAKQRLYNVARKRAIKVRVFVRDDKLIAVLKGETRNNPTRKGTDMKVEAYKGDLPKRTSGKTRSPNPFDELVKTNGTHKVTLEKGDVPKKIVAQIRNAAKFADKGVKLFVTDKEIIFVVQKRIIRQVAAKADA